MKLLPLYPEPPKYAVEVEPPADLDQSCRRCKLHDGVKTVCMPAEGDPGGVLLIGDHPGRDEDARGRPFVGQTGDFLRRTVARYWDGPVASDSGLKCSPGARAFADKEVDACRAYLAQIIRETKPSRIITLGSTAAKSVLGRAVAPFSTRKGYAWLRGATPVFLTMHPGAALKNRFVRAWFEDDMRWALTADLVPPPWKQIRFKLVETVADATAAVAELRSAGAGTYDAETAGRMYDPSYHLLSISTWPMRANQGHVWPQAALDDPSVSAVLLAWLVDEGARKIGQNLKYDMLAVHARYGVMPRGCSGDTRLWRKLLESEADGRLAAMADLVGLGGHKDEAAAAKEDAIAKVQQVMRREAKEAKSKNLRLFDFGEDLGLGLAPPLEAYVRENAGDHDSYIFALLPKPILHRYNARDSYVTALLADHLEAQVNAEPNLQRIWDRVISPATDALAQVEAWGINVSRSSLVAFDEYLAGQETELKARLDAYSPGMNWGSTQQVSEFLFNKLKLPVVKKTDSGAPSTDAESLEALRMHHSCVGSLLDFRGVEKMRGTYASGMLMHVRADGRIHPNLKLDGARSGRLACNSPNLQNIPRADSIEGKMARDVFAAAPGYTLVQADFGQLELRIAASLSGDQDMKAIFTEGVDYHQRTAELVARTAWGIDPSQVEKKHRSIAKIINFSTLYGAGDGSIAKRAGVTVGEAARVREAIFGKFKKLSLWMEEQLTSARKTGYCWTQWDGQPARRRSLWRIADADQEARNTAENGSSNSPIQGTASDYCLASLVEVVRWIREDAVPAKLVIAVHDSLMLEVRNDVVGEVAWQLRRIMTSWPCGVPLEVDVEIGDSWGSLHKITDLGVSLRVEEDA